MRFFWSIEVEEAEAEVKEEAEDEETSKDKAWLCKQSKHGKSEVEVLREDKRLPEARSLPTLKQYIKFNVQLII